jgi:DNA-binding MarR family transcriptional regulator
MNADPTNRAAAKDAENAPGRPDVSIDLDRYVPFYVTAIANRWTSISSQDYLREFGIGIAEWRVLASLDARGSATSLDIVTLVGMDGGAVSRAIRALERKELVVPVKGRFIGRTKPYAMTKQGKTLSGAVRARALEREAMLLQDLDDSERAELLRMLRLLHGRLADLALDGASPDEGAEKSST